MTRWVLPCALAAASCSPRPDAQPPATATQDDRPAVEHVPAGEPEAIDRIDDVLQAFVRHRFRETGVARRDAHTKAHGCVTATVHIDPDLPPELAVGLFAAPASFPAWIRFSNSADHVQRDRKPDGRGMAIKLMNVPGDKALPGHEHETSQDFILIDYPVFVVKDALDYVTFAEDSTNGHPLRFFFHEGKQYRPELKSAEKLALQRVVSPIAPTYYSMTPYAFGEGMAVKYGAAPCEPDERKRRRLGHDYLRTQLTHDLRETGACFRLSVQRQTDPVRMPIEDPTVPWSTSQSPYRPVATVEIPAQAFDTSAQNAMCEALSFNPWHARVEHRPLGGINRVRKVVYEAISKLRHELSGVRTLEPTDHDVSAYLSAIGL